jgi:hypothetical protein
MKSSKTILVAILIMAASLTTYAQSVLGPGDSATWQFQFQYTSTEMVNSPDQSYGGYVALGYAAIYGAGPLEYRVEFFEDFNSLQPVMSVDVPHSKIIARLGGGLLWLPEFAPPADAWADLDGALRISVLSGQMRNLAMDTSLLVPASPGQMDYYQAVVVPEPGTLGLLAVGAVLSASRFRRRCA